MSPTTKAEQTRQAIVDAAMGLFRSGGYDKTTMRAIAAEADVSLGNAYYYFSSKEQTGPGVLRRYPARSTLPPSSRS